MLETLKTQLDGKVHTVRRFLQRPIQLNDGNLVLGLSPSAQRAQAREARRRIEQPMQRALYELLGQHPSSRALMRHLDLVERALRIRGLAGVQALPTRVIAKALDQLERLVWDWSNAPLADLRSRLAVMVKSRPADDARSTHAAELEVMRQADVTEVDHATYEEMERSWAGQVPQAAS